MSLKLSLVQRLYLGIGAAALVVAAAGALMFKLSFNAEATIRNASSNATGAAALADAQSALWELRWGVAQFMVVDAAGGKKITDSEPKLRARIDEDFRRYEASSPTAEELKSLAELKVAFTKYMDARPKWFELQAAGKIDEAREWRAATTTPFGAATVKGFSEVISTQLKMSEQEDLAALQSIKTERATILALLLLLAAGSLVGGVLYTRSLRRSLAEANAVTVRLARGDLSVQPRKRNDDEIGELMAHLEQMTGSLRQLIGNVRATSDSIGTASTQIASGNHDLSARTEQTASSLQQTASSMEELTGTVKQTADSARTANQLATSAREVAARGGNVVAQVVSTMDEINTSSKKIADIIGTIDGIAFQTNILALNAAVEAARAGEQGRGFAVVASEVRSLAQRSAEAAREIKALIGASVDRVESGSRLVQDAGSTMTEIVASVQRVTDIIGEISAAAAEQSSGIGQVNVAVAQLDQMTQQNAALVEESAAAAESLKDQSRKLTEAVSAFDIGADVRGATRASPEIVAKAVIQQSRSTATRARVRQAAAPAPVVSAAAPARAGGSAAVTAASDDGWEAI